MYIEAYKRTHVKQAVEGINFLRMAVYEQEMVPTNQMKDVLRVIKTTQQLKPGMWVRLKARAHIMFQNFDQIFQSCRSNLINPEWGNGQQIIIQFYPRTVTP